jgi:hypothetical protein
MNIQELITEYLNSEQIVEDLQNNNNILKNEHFSSFINEKYHLERPYHPDLSFVLVGKQLSIYEKENPNLIFKKRTMKGIVYMILQPIKTSKNN